MDLPEGKSLYLFGPNNKCRLLIHKIIKSKYFDYTIILTILVSCLQLSLESPLNDPESTLAIVLIHIDIITASIFFTEMMLIVIANGFVLNGKKSYIR